MFSGGPQRERWTRLIERYRRESGELQLLSEELEQRAYKDDFEARLAAQPADVMFWFAGERLREYVARGLVAPLTQLAQDDGWARRFLPAALDAVTVDGRIYGMPLSTYQWGFYYRRSLFERLKLQPPATWDEWLSVNDRLRAAGHSPIIVGAKDAWTLGAWFDYLNLRLNGKAFHLELMAGRVSWLDTRTRAAFERWKLLIDRGDFHTGAAELNWRQALPYLSRDYAGTVLMGNFVSLEFPARVRADIGFFPFPQLSPKVAAVEEAPLDVLLVPTKARNPAKAERYLRWMAQAEVLDDLNESMGMLAPQRASRPPADPLLEAGARLLTRASASTQYFDRDSRAAFAGPALARLQKFLAHPNVNAVLADLEALRLTTGG
jgi:multiple sugar transport system substrate-binding protein